ncbi:MAG: HAD family phosphatase [Oscillospiraceae bacterium]|nr:HAD family phosphatase [Oscillospiraceae bacterium]
MIKNIILDIGDVLVKSNYHEFFTGKGYDEETAVQLEKATFFTPVWKELDRGVWSFDEIIDGFVKNDPEMEEQLRTVFNDMNGFIKVYSYAADWVCSMKESGLKVFCLSNISDKICRDCAKDMDFLKHTDGYVLSYEERLIKPDPEIFRLILDRYGLCAEECIFIDDIRQNVIAAKELGIHGIVFRDKTQAENEIEMIRRSEK